MRPRCWTINLLRPVRVPDHPFTADRCRRRALGIRHLNGRGIGRSILGDHAVVGTHPEADADSGVTIERDTVVDPAAGEFRVDIAEDALEGEWGATTQRVTVDPPGDSRQSWRGDVTLTAVGETA